MRSVKAYLLAAALTSFGLIRAASAATVLVNANIAVSTHWTADNTYNLQTQIYVLPGATLTIDPGVVVASTTNLGGSLAVTRGGKIFVNGTADNPVIMTSLADVATWAVDATNPTGHNPHTGQWREGVNEWGNLTLMGRALISASEFGGTPIPGNTATPTGLNVKQMEGLTAAFPGDPNVIYGGNDDNDSSGELHYLSLRYGGKVVGLGNELNGLSMGGIGRGTIVDHIDIMNNVDDGYETWGGTVNYKYMNVWNIGDDSMDIDEGWRGKAQFGLLVQGYSTDAARGSGVGDNCFEMDGAEDSDAQPVTTGVIYNFTAIGQPLSARGGSAWRDNCRMQFHNCIWMNVGQDLVRFDNNDGDGQSGYGFNGTLSWPATWTTDFTAHSAVNQGSFTGGAFNDPAVLYQSQTSGKLAEITDSVFYQNTSVVSGHTAYGESDARGVTVSGGSNPTLHNVVATQSPIMSLTRGAAVTKGGLQVLPVTNINPTPINDAAASSGAAPNDGFFTPANYRGAFSPVAGQNWLKGWTAAWSYGMVSDDVKVGSNISTSTHWTADNTYNLTTQIYVLPGATLMIDPGVVVASDTNSGGSLAVCQGGKIFANGTADNPIIMTSKADVATWDLMASHPTGHNPKTGKWREGVNEWGNLTLMGKALISASEFGGTPIPGNTATPTGLNKRQMEGLTAAFPGDPNVIYGGNDDNDSSGELHYLSLRYGGKVLGLGNELNGLSMGGIGRGTLVDHIDIMNNVDDGYETWGGTVNYKYMNVWNIGDDSMDIDEGWRGKAQFGLLVQGYSTDASQGSGVGDNLFEMDGAEDSDAQPVTTGVIYNFTAIGQPLAGRGGTAWRDNCRMQFHNCLWMDVGQQLVKFDNNDGDGQSGYGFNGTLSWADTWTSDYTVSFTNVVNEGVLGSVGDPLNLYKSQTNGKLAEIVDSVFYNNNFSSGGLNAYSEADARGVRAAANDNVTAAPGQMPIQQLTRAAAVTKGGKTELQVIKINPLPANDAVISATQGPNDGFLIPAKYRGGFSGFDNWIQGWTAADAYGFVVHTNQTNAVPQERWTQYR